MSSLAAVQADGYYHPPDWVPSEISRDKFQGSKGSNQYQQYGIIRFEMPHHAWCEGCGRHIARGTRFNSKKDKDGAYYSTTIWKFTMKCPSCSHELVIKTDPANTDYEFAEGIRRKITGFDTAAEGESEALPDPEATVKAMADPMLALENAQRDKIVAETRKSAMQRLIDSSDARHADDYRTNAFLRRGNRLRRKEEKAKKAEAEAKGLSIPLATPSPGDAAAAAKINFRRPGIVSSSSTKGKTSAAAAARQRAQAAALAKARSESAFGGDLVRIAGAKRPRSDGSSSSSGSTYGGAAGGSGGSTGSAADGGGSAGEASFLRVQAVRNPRHATAPTALQRQPVVGMKRRVAADADAGAAGTAEG